ncbi:hypothetical protein MPSI1_002687 [Malassezia psittaci]|uniref:Uncharacterized protein n=1 Tax=Malassezia psittaci TaxID=1821823 RepID=A0AAF0JEH5_9BASI|nr:hypothetical protein MPSI1_002687 [Malassezia psittaci]
MNLLILPVEVSQLLTNQLLYQILLTSLNPNLPIVCRKLRDVLDHAPKAVKSEYLLGKWLESYTSRFVSGLYRAQKSSLLDYKFVPTTYPSSSSTPNRRGAATCDILSYIARFGLCTPELLGQVERCVLGKRYYGNITQLYGLFETDEPALYPHHLACHTVPERIVRHMDVYRTASELACAPDILKAPLLHMIDTLESMVPSALRTTSMPRPCLAHLELLLRFILIHRATPNSLQGYILAAAIHYQSLPLISFLLAVGADPSLKDGIAIQLASKKGWLDGLRLLVERDDRLELQWKYHIHTLRETMHTLAALRAQRNRLVPRRIPELGRPKRQKLGDRFKLGTAHLKAAVRSQAWDIVVYMMQNKSVIPDVDTLRLMEALGMPN